MNKQRIIGIILFLIGILLDFFVELIVDDIKRWSWYIENRTWIFIIGATFILAGGLLTFVNISKEKDKISGEDSQGTSDISLLDKDQDFLNEQLIRHQENLRKLLRQKSIYAAGEEPLHLLNQSAAEEKKIREIEQQLQNLRK